MRHHLETIVEYAKSGDNSAILSYIREYSTEVSEAAVRQYSINKTINSIPSAYAGKTEKSSIAFGVKCNAPAKLAVRDIDLIALLGNLPTGKSIGISSILSVCRKYDGNLDYKIENGICSVCAVLNL